VAVSAVSGEGTDKLLDTIRNRLHSLNPVLELAVPFERGDVLAALHREGEVLVEVHGDRETRVRVRMPRTGAHRFDEFVVENGAPPSSGPHDYRRAAAAWIDRRFGVSVSAEEVIACVGTKELVSSLPRVLSLRDPSRDVVLYPGVAYPSYEMGAQLAGLRPVA